MYSYVETSLSWTCYVSLLLISTVMILGTSVLLIYEKRLLPRCIQQFKSDLIYSMDHMRISGTESSSVILSQIK